MLKYYPVSLNLVDKNCVVVGGGKVAERKVRRLLNYGAKVKVISPKITPALKVLVKYNKITWKNRCLILKDIAGAFLVISAADSRKLNSRVFSYCKKKSILANVVDSPRECNFILPSVIRRGDLTISISTSGISPALSKSIRIGLEKSFGQEYAKFLKLIKDLRPKIITKIASSKQRKQIFNSLVKSAVLPQIKRGKINLAKATLNSILKKKHVI